MNNLNCHCLILFATNRCKERARIQLSRANMQRTRSAVASPHYINAVAFLPEVYCRNHPGIVEIFKKNEVILVCNDDELLLPTDHDMWSILEVLLDDGPEATVDPVSMILTCKSYFFKSMRETLLSIFSRTELVIISNDTLPKMQDLQTSRTSTHVKSAVDDGNCQVFKELLNGPFVHSIISGDRVDSMLCSALFKEQEILIQLALDHEADTSYVLEGIPLLHWAFMNVSWVKPFLEKDAEVDLVDEEKKTALHYACKNQQSIELIEILLEAGASIDARAKGGLNALHFAAKYQNMCGYVNPAIIDLLVNRGIPIDSKNDMGLTPLGVATNCQLMKALLENGADANSMGPNQETTLYKCIEEGQNLLEQVKILLDFGLLVDSKHISNNFIPKEVLLFLKRIDPEVFSYVLERCFVHHLPLTKAQINELASMEHANIKLLNRRIFARHLAKIISLQQDVCDDDTAQSVWDENEINFSQFKKKCESEVSQMQRHIVPGTDLSVYDVLMMNEFSVACLLRNPLVEFDLQELEKLFPSYTKILMHHIHEGRNRFSLQKQAICSYKTFHLSVPDIMNLKRACHQPAIVRMRKETMSPC